MVIEKVIFTIDDNPHYAGFWQSIRAHIERTMGWRCKLFVIGRGANPEDYNPHGNDVECVDDVDGIPTIIQALIGKFYFTQSEPDTTWLIGDLDLYPMSRNSFTDSILNIDPDKYVHLRPFAYGRDWRNNPSGLAGYFHAAKGRTFAEELNLDRSFRDVVSEIAASDRWGIKFHNGGCSEESRAASDDWGWFCCEEMYAGEKLRDSRKLVEIEETANYRRIDRSDLSYSPNAVALGHYHDMHAPRPYSVHRQFIETAVSLVPSYQP